MAKIDDVIAQIAKLARTRVLVGIPQEKNARPGSPIGNAVLGYIHETGSPAQNIPPRPFLRPGVANSQSDWMPKLEAAGKAAADGQPFERYLQEAGTLAVRGVTRRMQAGIPPPLKPATVRARQRRTTGSTYRRLATTAANTTPLIDTGTMLRSITYVIRKI